ncbi:MAG: hypothetical protein JW751_30455 [Polyangiaceae bacterium]|nr:hypothetical protein [Polyangiaceae bacterium]
MRRLGLLGGGVGVTVVLLAAEASAEPELALERVQRGGFLLIGNTLGFDCSEVEEAEAGGDRGGVPAPLEGTAACAETYGSEAEIVGADDFAPDLYWSRIDGVSTAAAATVAVAARSGASLVIPSGTRITDARLYWAGYLQAEREADAEWEVDRVIHLWAPEMGDDAEPKEIEADRWWTAPQCQAQAEYCAEEEDRFAYYYQATADITPVVAGHGAGTYAVSDVASLNDIRGTNEAAMSGWWLVVFYEAVDTAHEALLDLRLFEGLDVIGFDADVPDPGITVSLERPGGATAEVPARVGIVAYDGDAWLGGDYVRVGDAQLRNTAQNEQNFFDSSRTIDGNPASGEGDFPRLSGEPRSMAGLDLDVAILPTLASSANVTAIRMGSEFERYVIGAVVTAVPTSAPLLHATMTVAPVADDTFVAGGTARYTVEIVNVGNTPAAVLELRDDLPPELTVDVDTVAFSGAGSGAWLEPRIAIESGRLTIEASPASAGRGSPLMEGDAVTVTFDAVIDPALAGCVENPCTISNQAAVVFAPTGTDPSTTVMTDGFPTTSEPDPTVFTVDVGCLSATDCPTALPACVAHVCVECAEAADCPAEDPVCLETRCVECTTDDDCATPTAPACDRDLHACVCPEGTSCGGAGVDTDGDGLTDETEAELGSNPEDSDTDDDGVPDGDEPGGTTDDDGDGLIGLLDPDSDDDGLLDGTELGYDCSLEDTDLEAERCRADADPDTTTDPLDPDTDGNGASDGSEDPDLDGRIEDGETDPNDPSDDADVSDSDGDGLGDALEVRLGGDPDDTDTDDDGVPDGEEPNPTVDTDGDGATSIWDVDSDNDGLFDGTELGYDCEGPGTDESLGHCRADADEAATTTSPLLADTDGGGLADGSEDHDLDGRIDDGETDPNDPTDDHELRDSDDDGLSDALEAEIGSDPNDTDTDDDGVLDGEEPNPTDDLDGDGLIAVLDLDGDNDLLLDGVELGTLCSDPDSNPEICLIDADAGATITSVLMADTDHDGLPDAYADVDHNGVIDARDELFLDGEIRGGGCGCSVPRRSAGRYPWLLLGLAALSIARRRGR